jgi:hypothetical protein
MKVSFSRLGAFAVTAIFATMAVAFPAAARSEPTFTMVFVNHGSDPCSGAAQTVTIVADFWVHETNGATVTLQQRTITSDPTGYVGRGESTVVSNGEVIVMSLHDMLVNGSGARVRIAGTVILDASTTPPTAIVRNLTRECVQP